MQIIHYGLRFSGNIWLSLLSQNDSCKIPPFWHQNLLISFLICLNVIVVLIKVKVNQLSISGRSLQDKWHHRHLNSCDSAFQNGDRFQVLTDFNEWEDTWCKHASHYTTDAVDFYFGLKVRVMVFNITFNNISVISWLLVLLVEVTGVPGENHRCRKLLTNFIT